MKGFLVHESATEKREEEEREGNKRRRRRRQEVVNKARQPVFSQCRQLSLSREASTHTLFVTHTMQCLQLQCNFSANGPRVPQ